MDHNHSHGDMSMSPTATGAAPSPTAAAMDHSSHGGMGGCKISMLWNWNVMDSCFLSSSWHITSKGMFAGSCIGVILLVMTLEFLRRLGKEYDRYLVRQYQAAAGVASSCTPPAGSDGESKTGVAATAAAPPCAPQSFRPNVLEQAIRGLLHMLQFAVAYFVMLLAMYYNGYIIICIFIGAFLGSFIFSWEHVTFSGPKEEITVCCG